MPFSKGIHAHRGLGRLVPLRDQWREVLEVYSDGMAADVRDASN